MAIYRDEAGNIISRKKENAKNSDARIRANTRYTARARAAGKIKQLNMTISAVDAELIDTYINTHNISKKAFIMGAIKYCIAHNIDLTAEQDSEE